MAFFYVHYVLIYQTVTNVRFRSIGLCAVKSRTYLAGESPAPEGAASATG